MPNGQEDKNKLLLEKENNYKIGISCLERANQTVPEDEIVQLILLELYTDLDLNTKRKEYN